MATTIFQDIEHLKEDIALFHQFIHAVSGTVITEGGPVRNIAKISEEYEVEVTEISTRLDGIEDSLAQLNINLTAGRIGFLTKANMDANLNYDEGTIAEVMNDPPNYGTYVKQGASGTGSWLLVADDRIADISKRMYEITGQYKTFVQDILDEYGLKILVNNTSQRIPVVVDDNERVVLAFDKDSGHLISAGTDFLDSETKPIAPIVVDKDNRLSIGIEKDTGKVLMDPHFSTTRLGMAAVGTNIEIPIEGAQSDIAWALVDKNMRLALAVKTNGKLEAYGGIVGGTTVVSSAPQGNKVSIDADINHYLFYGQSLSVGAAGQPVLTTTQPYANVTFRGGPRSDLNEVDDFKPLVEDADPAPDGGTNRGETVCSSAGNMVTRLIGTENNWTYQQAGYDMLVSTAGHGGYRIDQLDKGTAWYDYVTAHIQGGFDVSQVYNKTYALHAVGWLQGENDVASAQTKETYKADLKQLRLDIDTDAKAITGQTHDVVLISYQMAWSAITSSKIPLAHLEAAEEDSNIYIATPMYHFPYAADKVHLNNIGYMWAGHYFGRAYKRIVYDGIDWKPTSPKSIYRQGKVIDILFNVPEPPLVLDSTTLGTIADSGFKVLDELAQPVTIASVQVAGPDRVRIVLATNPTGPLKIRYGLDYSSAILDQYISGAAGGQLRDSSADTWEYLNSLYPLWNWCVIFEKEVN